MTKNEQVKKVIDKIKASGKKVCDISIKATFDNDESMEFVFFTDESEVDWQKIINATRHS